MATTFEVLPAHHGDSMIIQTTDLNNMPVNIVIDGGTSKTYEDVLRGKLGDLDKIDLLVLTHIDTDHINGLISYINSPNFDRLKVSKYWFNNKNLSAIPIGDNISSYRRAVTFEELLLEKRVPLERIESDIITYQLRELAPGVSIEILSPTSDILETLRLHWPELEQEEDQVDEAISISAGTKLEWTKSSLEDLANTPFKPSKSLSDDIKNASSLAFLLKTPDLSMLHLGDSRPEIVVPALMRLEASKEKKLKVDYVKVSHHGSVNNSTNELYDLLDCNNFIISTNGGLTKHRLPDRLAIARIVHHPERKAGDYKVKRIVYFNYPIESIIDKVGPFINDNDFKTGNWQAEYQNKFPLK